MSLGEGHGDRGLGFRPFRTMGQMRRHRYLGFLECLTSLVSRGQSDPTVGSGGREVAQAGSPWSHQGPVLPRHQGPSGPQSLPLFGAAHLPTTYEARALCGGGLFTRQEEPELGPREGDPVCCGGRKLKPLQGLGLAQQERRDLSKGATYLRPPCLPERDTGQPAPWLGCLGEGHQDRITNSYSSGRIPSITWMPETILEVLHNYLHVLSSPMRSIPLLSPFGD